MTSVIYNGLYSLRPLSVPLSKSGNVLCACVYVDIRCVCVSVCVTPLPNAAVVHECVHMREGDAE